MNEHDLYESWKRRRARAEVPLGFAGRVMARIVATAPRRVSPETRRFTLTWLWPRLAPVGLLLLAFAVCLVRLRILFSTFLDIGASP